MLALRAHTYIGQLGYQVRANAFDKHAKLLLREYASYAGIVQCVHVAAFDGVAADCFGELFPICFWKKPEAVQANRRVDFGNNAEAESRSGYSRSAFLLYCTSIKPNDLQTFSISSLFSFLKLTNEEIGETKELWLSVKPNFWGVGD
jgi:hypothetical protein